MKTFEALRYYFDNYKHLEDFQKIQLTEYLACPDVDDCAYDRDSEFNDCAYCKLKWLNSKWK